jgi:hypothetical protein
MFSQLQKRGKWLSLNGKVTRILKGKKGISPIDIQVRKVQPRSSTEKLRILRDGDRL